MDAFLAFPRQRFADQVRTREVSFREALGRRNPGTPAESAQIDRASAANERIRSAGHCPANDVCARCGMLALSGPDYFGGAPPWGGDQSASRLRPAADISAAAVEITSCNARSSVWRG